MRNTGNRRRGELVLLWAALLSITVLMTGMNAVTPLFADDFSYSVSFVTKEPFTAFREVLASQYLHYFTTNGRSVVHTLAQVLLWIGKPVLNVINGAAFASLCLLICYHGLGSFARIRTWHVVVVFAGLWFLTPHFGGSYLWVMGAANYMYSPQIILLYLVRYRRLFRHQPDDPGAERDSWPGALVWLLAGVIAGWTNENTSLALLCMTACVPLLRLIRKERIYRWIWAGAAGNIIGCLLLFCSPAQGKRLSAAGGFGGVGQWIQRFVSISSQALVNFYPLILLLAFAGMVWWLQNKGESCEVRLKKLEPTVIYGFGSMISLYSMVGSPEFPVWVWSSILIFFLITVISMFSVLRLRGPRQWKWISTGICAALILAVAVSFRSVMPELLRVKDAYDCREAQIEQACRSGSPVIDEPIVSDCTYSSYSLFLELNQDPKSWPNTAIANYYGIPSIASVPK